MGDSSRTKQVPPLVVVWFSLDLDRVLVEHRAVGWMGYRSKKAWF